MKPKHLFVTSVALLASTFLFAGEAPNRSYTDSFLESNHLLSQGFFYIRGNSPEIELDPDDVQATIGWWNICGTHLSPIYGGVVPWKERVEKILEKVQENDPDVMIFQEVYDSELADLLVEGLRDRYAHLFVHLGPNPGGYEGGCMILSKSSVHQFTNTSFHNNTSFLNRGFGVLEIKTSQKSTVPCLRIIGTHILYGYDNVERIKREAQIEQIQEHIRSLPSCPTLIAADFNTEREDPSLSFLEHGYKGKECTCMTTPLIRQWDPTTSGPEEEWIDNISLFKGSKGKIDVHLIPAFDPGALDAKTALSDHHFLIGNYSANSKEIP